MFLYKHKNGKYYLYYNNPSGKRTAISTRTKKKSEALKFLSQFDAELKKRERNKTIPINLKSFFFQFLKYSESIHSYKHTCSMKSSFKQLVKYFGDIQIAEFTRYQLQEYIEFRLSKLTAYTVRRDLANLSSSLNWGISKNYLLVNICKGIKKPPISEKLPLFFSEEEFQILLNVIENEDLKDLIKFAVLTGLRQSELISLDWKQINLHDSSLILDNRNRLTKSRKIHNIPLNIKALQILDKRRFVSKSNFVFTYLDAPIKQQFISHKFKKFIKKTDLNQKLNFHSLRHTFGSWLVQKGVPIYQVSKLMTHSDIRVTQVYAHLSSENLIKSVNLL